MRWHYYHFLYSEETEEQDNCWWLTFTCRCYVALAITATCVNNSIVCSQYLIINVFVLQCNSICEFVSLHLLMLVAMYSQYLPVQRWGWIICALAFHSMHYFSVEEWHISQLLAKSSDPLWALGSDYLVNTNLWYFYLICKNKIYPSMKHNDNGKKIYLYSFCSLLYVPCPFPTSRSMISIIIICANELAASVFA